MRRKLDAVRGDLSWFVDQREELILVFDITEHEVPYLLKVLQMVEGEHTGDLFVMFAHNCSSVEQYMTDLVQTVKVQIAGVNELREEDGDPAWPPLPPAVEDPRCPPSTRIQSLLGYIRAQLPEDDHHIVFGLLPTKIEDTAAYTKVIDGLFPRRGLQPWMTGVRLILRDDRRQPFVLPMLEREQPQRVLIYDQLDLGPAAVTQALIDDAADPEVPEAERMSALVQLAALDFSHRRYGESYRKWGVLFAYYDKHGAPAMQALCLCGAADVLRASGKLPEAKERYQQGLALAQTREALPAALNLLIGISETCIARQEWTEAEGYLDLADQVASKCSLVYPKCDIMERHGLALLALRRTADARSKWRAAADLSREMKHFTRCESVLGNLVRLFDEAKMPVERREHARELEEVQRERKAFETEQEAARA